MLPQAPKENFKVNMFVRGTNRQQIPLSLSENKIRPQKSYTIVKCFLTAVCAHGYPAMGHITLQIDEASWERVCH